MTKKDYVLIAGVIKEARGNYKPQLLYNSLIAEKMADKLQKQNPRFDREKFLKACGVEAEKEYTHCKLCGDDFMEINGHKCRAI